ncbi:MAG: hypothetical protein RL885_00330 [Planctomycetota bacterium]
MKAPIATLGLMLMLLWGLTPTTEASSGRRPGSVLVFTSYFSDPVAGTVISVTNTKDAPSFDPNTNLDGVVDVHFIYIDQDGWREFNRYERLTPNDTFSTITSVHNPSSYTGFLYCIALDPNTQQPVSHNWLIGDSILAISVFGWLYASDAVGFRSLTPEGQPADLNGNGLVDLDGVEYDAVPDQMLCSSFIGSTVDEDFYIDPFNARLELVSFVSLVGNSDYETRLDFTVYNDNEQQFSTSLSFRCAELGFLLFDFVFENEFLASTNHDPRNNGLGNIETGWFRVDGHRAVDVVGNEPAIEDPPFLASYFSLIIGGSTGRLFHESNEPNQAAGVLDMLL